MCNFMSTPRLIKSRSQGILLLVASVNKDAFQYKLFSENRIKLPAKLANAAERRQADFLSGRLLVIKAQLELGLPVSQVAFGVDRAPIWPHGQRGSISHTDERVACLLAGREDSSLGVDMERIPRECNISAIRDEVLLETERFLVDHCKYFPTGVMETLIFSAKEAIFKAVYPLVRCAFGFDCAELCIPPTCSKLYFRLTRKLSNQFPLGSILVLQYEYSAPYVISWIKLPCTESSAVSTSKCNAIEGGSDRRPIF